MNPFRFLLPLIASQPKMENPAHTQMRKVRGKIGEPSRTNGGRFARQVIRHRQRQRKAYHPGVLGLSNVSKRILNQYGTWMTRRERKRQAKATKTPLRLFYNGPVAWRSKGGKVQ